MSAMGDEFVVGRPGALVSMRSGNRRTLTGTEVATIKAGVPLGESEYLCVNSEGEIARYDLRGSEKEILQRTGHRSDVWAIAHGRGGPVAVSLDSDRQLVLFHDGHVSPNLYSVDPRVNSFAISPDGDRLAAGTKHGWVGFLQRRKNGTWKYSTVLDSPVSALAFAPDGGRVAIGCLNGSVTVVRPDGTFVASAQLSDRPITEVAISGTSDQVVALDSKRRAHGFSPDKGRFRIRAPRPPAPEDEPRSRASPSAAPVATAFTIFRGDVLVGFADGTVTGDRGGAIEFGAPVRDLVVVDIGGKPGILAATSKGYWLVHHPVGDGDPTYLGYVEWAAACFRPKAAASHIGLDGRLVEVVRSGDTLSIKKVGGGGFLPEPLGEHPGCQVVHCAYFEDGPLAFTGGTDGRVRVWDLRARKAVDTLVIGQPVWRIDTVSGRHLLVGAGGELLRFDHFTGSKA